MIRMPGESFRGSLPPPSVEQQEAAGRLQNDVVVLGGTIGERNVFRPDALNAAADWIEKELRSLGYAVSRQDYAVHLHQEGLPKIDSVACFNLEVEIPGGSRAEEIVVVGAHYDSVYGCPGANDNGSGVAAVLELARRFADTIRGALSGVRSLMAPVISSRYFGLKSSPTTSGGFALTTKKASNSESPTCRSWAPRRRATGVQNPCG